MRKKRWVERAYERFLESPVPLVLVVLWYAGAAAIGSLVLALYLYGSALVRMVLGP